MDRRTSHRTPRKAYTVDAFDTVPELQGASRSPSPTRGGTAQDLDTPFDDDNEDLAAHSDDEISEADATHSNDASEADDSEDGNFASEVGLGNVQQAKQRQSRSKLVRDDTILYSRRLQDNFRSLSKKDRRRRLFGALPEDAAPTAEATTRWSALPVLPTKTADASGKGGFSRPVVADSEVVHHLQHTEWLWYFGHGGDKKFVEKQTSTPISLQEAAPFLPQLRDSCDFLIGPLNSPTLQSLPTYNAISLADAWSATEAGHIAKESRAGFILNAGASVNNLEWIPFREDTDQYVAISVLPERSPKHAPFEAPVAPAYASSAPYKTSLQIWQVSIRPAGTAESKPAARLTSLLCTSWGDIKHFKFCPMECAISDKATPLLLAGIWGDGKLRIIDVHEPMLTTEQQATHIETAAVELGPIDTVFTCLSWMSPRLVAAACANGCVALIDIHKCLNEDTASPLKYASISDTYIHGISSCWPSHPTHIFTLSMDGFVRLTDTTQANMASPEATAQSNRVRAVLPGLVWSEYAQSSLVTDDNFVVRAYPLRRMFSHFSAGRTKSTALSIANSSCHPYILLGTASGDVVSLNPLVRLYDYKRPLYTQIWFSHEWRRPVIADHDRPDAIGGNIVRNGLVRFVEGYKVEHIRFNDNDGSTRNYAPQTVYEKNSAATAVAWNPNLPTAGWAAAGFADGLVRLQDIAVPS